MRPCVVGIGGAGGNILKQFLQSEDISLKIYQFGKPLAFGNVKGVWLESAIRDAEDQSFYHDLSQGNYPGYLICHELVDGNSATNGYIMDTYGLNLKARGYDRRAEYLKSIFEIFDYDTELKEKCSEEFRGYENPLSGYMWKAGIRQFVDISTSKSARNGNGNGRRSSKLCDSILFLASLGGGTGTGFINPITRYVREENADFPIFVAGVLTEKGSDDRHAPEGKRDLGAVIAMHDLMTREAGTGIDGLIPVDNQILVERYAKDFPAMDSYIHSSLKPLLDTRNYPGYHLQDDSQAIRGVFREVDNGGDQEKIKKNLFPPLLVPCYHIQPDYVGDINTLVEGALGNAEHLFPFGKDGRLFPCDPAKADRALIFTRGFFSSKEIMEAVQRRIDLPESEIKIYRKLGDSKNEDMLVLLRNPYGGTPGEHERRGTLEWRLHDVITQAIKYIDENKTNILEFDYTPVTRNRLEKYFYGENGLRDELFSCLHRLENGERPIFLSPLRIFGNGAVPSAVPEGCQVDREMLAADKARLREMVKAELREILGSEDCKKRLKEVLKS